MSVAIPQFEKKIQKSLYGTAHITVPAAWSLAALRIYTLVAARWAVREREHCRSCSADLGALVEDCIYFFTPRYYKVSE
ncbi:hypothetical protein E2C01_064156 [Portunus trituberculatus]|uniref:Uncharacterized protein n=1 Tax=Portunus trituberculatus TaxID=210409 RepID=A0A5B7HIB5_PORTR|nr:hypothetical protein [Portunus trituberculatus]